jgi:hypothetical protein
MKILVMLLIAGCGRLSVLSGQCDQMMGDSQLEFKYVRESNRSHPGPYFGDSAPSGPSELFKSFEKMDRRFSANEAKGCGTSRRRIFGSTGTSFQDEWVFQQEVEQRRLDALVRLGQRKAAAEAEHAGWRAEVSALATKHGYDGVIFDRSLTEVIQALLSGELKLTDTRGWVIEIDRGEDSGFTALQILGQGSALYTSDATDAVLILREYGDQLLEHSPLTAIENHYVTIKGVTRYSTLLGPRQAFLIECAW